MKGPYSPIPIEESLYTREQLEEMATSSDYRDRVRAARHGVALERLAHDSAEAVRFAVALHIKTGEEPWVQALAKDPSVFVRRAVQGELAQVGKQKAPVKAHRPKKKDMER